MRRRGAREVVVQSESESVGRAVGRASALTERIARVADEIADSEERVAQTYEDAARVRPHAADRLHGAARDARDFAAHEREQSRLLRSRQSDAGDDA